MNEVQKEAEPFFFEGNEIAVLVVHGFTGSTQSMRYLGAQLNQQFGFTVSGPRLAGHGTSPNDMETTGYSDWVASAEEAMHQLAESYGRVFITGLSMGGTLTLNLAARFPETVITTATKQANRNMILPCCDPMPASSLPVRKKPYAARRSDCVNTG